MGCLTGETPLIPVERAGRFTTWFVVARGRIEVTPGCFNRVTGACVPNGETQGPVPAAGSYPAHGVHGAVRLTVVWTDRSSTTETTTQTVVLSARTPWERRYVASRRSSGGRA
jgi:hypothetical protein